MAAIGTRKKESESLANLEMTGIHSPLIYNSGCMGNNIINYSSGIQI